MSFLQGVPEKAAQSFESDRFLTIRVESCCSDLRCVAKITVYQTTQNMYKCSKYFCSIVTNGCMSQIMSPECKLKTAVVNKNFSN